jgi:hypothetical protein
MNAVLKASFVRGIKWGGLLAVAHYACTWATFLVPIVLLGDIDEPHGAARHQGASMLARIQHLLLEPLVHFGRGQTSTVVHVQMLLNSLLWGAVIATALLLLSSYRERRVTT